MARKTSKKASQQALPDSKTQRPAQVFPTSLGAIAAATKQVLSPQITAEKPASISTPVPPQPAACAQGRVAFVLVQPEAKRVWLTGDFNGWSLEATPMQMQGDGRWATTVALPPGSYEYKFVVDGQWLPDPNAREQRFNRFGTLNSVIEVQA